MEKEELKTLKEIERFAYIEDWATHGTEVATINELRAEAVKWVKKWNVWQNSEDVRASLDKGDLAVANLVGASGAFMEFFNLTEEDLK